MEPVAEIKEFERRFKLYQMFQDLSRRFKFHLSPHRPLIFQTKNSVIFKGPFETSKVYTIGL